ncbi:hypothetical protein, partial [Xanthomonas hortorum]|uniref:hypothetical protein n=1 Tax=Xanthomonas hortorum TaxID=56454 RepID=UPI0032E90859
FVYAGYPKLAALISRVMEDREERRGDDEALSITLHRARGRSYVVSAAIALVHDLRRSSRRGRNQHSTRM